MQSQNCIKKQATPEDVDGFVNILTLLIEDNLTSSEDLRAWLADNLNISSVTTAEEHADDTQQAEESNTVARLRDETDDTAQSIDIILKGLTDQGLHVLADILVELQNLTSKGPLEVMKANNELGKLVELVFRHSRSYRQSLRLYANRFDIIGGGDPDDYISQLVDGLLSDEEMTTIEE